MATVRDRGSCFGGVRRGVKHPFGPLRPEGRLVPVTAVPPASSPEGSFYDAVGGAGTFSRLVSHFYQGVRDDPVLRPLYPDEDLHEAEQRLRMFLEQYWGGPRTYGEQRGHPRLRMRHAPFAIGPAERDAWLARMRAAVDTLGLAPDAETTLWAYLEGAAYSLQNQP